MSKACLLVLAAVLATATSVAAAEPPAGLPSGSNPDGRTYEQTVAKAIAYLQDKGQSNDGSYSSAAGIGPTALITTALLRHGRTPEDPAVAKSLKYLEQHVQPDGGIYVTGSLYCNYETCLAIMCLYEANADGRYDKLIAAADACVKGLQWDEGEGQVKSDPAYGGAGYGKHKRPDLSNTSFLIDALRAAGNGADDEAIQRALIFVSRSQNLETEHNTTEFAAKNPDGGFYYTPAAGGQSMAEQNGIGRSAQLRLDDLRRAEEHDLRRREAGRSPRQGGLRMDPQALRAEREPQHGRRRSVLLLPHVCQGPRRRGFRHGGRRRGGRAQLASRTGGGTDETAETRWLVGQRRMTAGWKATRTS